MDRKAFEYFKNKRIKIFLKDRIVYSGFIEEIFEDSLIFIDKFDTKVAIPFTQIERIEEVKDDTAR
jgi:ribosome maturation factor RimP